MTHVWVSELNIIGSDNGSSHGRHQAIVRTSTGILNWPFRTNFSEMLIKIPTFSFKEMHLKMLSAKWRPFCLCLNVLILVKCHYGTGNWKPTIQQFLRSWSFQSVFLGHNRNVSSECFSTKLLNVTKYLLRIHQLITLCQSATFGPHCSIVCCHIKQWKLSHDNDDLAQCFREFTVMACQVKFYEHFLWLSLTNWNKNATFLFA